VEINLTATRRCARTENVPNHLETKCAHVLILLDFLFLHLVFGTFVIILGDWFGSFGRICPECRALVEGVEVRRKKCVLFWFSCVFGKGSMALREEETLFVLEDRKSGSTEIVDDVIVLEGDFHDRRSLQRQVLRHLHDQQRRPSVRKRSSRRKMEVSVSASFSDSDSDSGKEEWEELRMKDLQKLAGRSVKYLIPSALYNPLMFLIRIFILWPILFCVSSFAFTKLVFVNFWPTMILLLQGFVQFPYRFIISTLKFSERFAWNVIVSLKRIRRRAKNAFSIVWELFSMLFRRICSLFLRLQRMAKKHLRRLWVYFADLWYFFSKGALHVFYIISLPFRVIMRSVISFISLGSLTLASFSSIPIRVGHFIVNSPHIFGRRIRGMVKFVRDNKEDIVDVLIALAFLIILSMIISGVFLPLLNNFLNGIVMFLRGVRSRLARLRIPRIRLPRLNIQKLREILPSFPTKIPVPDLKLLLGIRQLSFKERLRLAFLGKR